MIYFSWHNRKWEYTTEMGDVGIDIKDAGGNPKVLKQLAADEAQKMLGVWLALDGNNTK